MTNHAQDLRDWTLRWARRWWDPEEALCWNPAGGFGELAPARSLHLVPNSANFIYGLLGTDDPADHAAAAAGIDRLISLQYDAPGTDFDGTFARFAEWPWPPEQPVMWEDYDPNWRQFVGTAFALMLEDFGGRLDPALAERMVGSIERACQGEPDDRIPINYTNPGLMRAWLDAWCGRRIGDGTMVERGADLAQRIVAEFDRFDAFDEYNSPTYYGVDLYALGLWRALGPTDVFTTEGARLTAAVWQATAASYHAGMGNFCGPYTRSYHPDATRSVAKVALFMWAVAGRDHAPLPDLDAEVIDHSHDLMSGPIIARLADPPAEEVLESFRRFTGERHLTQELAFDRHVEMALSDDLMLGAESSEHNWGTWDQFMPATAHWPEPDGSTGVLWRSPPGRTRASIDGRALVIDADGPVELLVQAGSCEVDGDALVTGGARVRVTGTDTMELSPVGDGRTRVSLGRAGDGAEPVRLEWKTASG